MPATSSKTRPVSVRLPVDVVEAIGDANVSAFLILAARQRIEGASRWRPLLGEDLADRVAAVAPKDPGAFCLRAVTDAVRTAERKNRDASARQAHSEARRPAAPRDRGLPKGRRGRTT